MMLLIRNVLSVLRDDRQGVNGPTRVAKMCTLFKKYQDLTFVLTIRYSTIIVPTLSLIAKWICVKDLPIEKLRVLRGKENVAWGDFTRLTSTANLGSLSKPFHLFCGARCWLQWCMNWSRCNGIHSDALFRELLGERSSE